MVDCYNLLSSVEAPVSHEVTGNDSVAQQSVVDGSPKFPQLISPAMMRTVPMLPRQPQIQIKSSPDIAFSNSAVENDVIHENSKDVQSL